MIQILFYINTMWKCNVYRQCFLFKRQKRIFTKKLISYIWFKTFARVLLQPEGDFDMFDSMNMSGRRKQSTKYTEVGQFVPYTSIPLFRSRWPFQSLLILIPCHFGPSIVKWVFNFISNCLIWLCICSHVNNKVFSNSKNV